MIKYLGAAAVLAAAYGIEGAIEVTTVILALLASMFYFMTLRLFTGLSQATLVENVDVLRMATIHMIYVTMTTVVFMSEYSYIALIAMPWIVIQTIINVLSVLIKLDIIGINHK